MRKLIVSAACAACMVAFSAPTASDADAAPVAELGSAIHINNLGCGMMNADGGYQWASSDRAVITPRGSEMISCKAKGIQNSSGRSVIFDYATTGLECWTDLGPTREWHQTITPSGNSTLTCFFR